MSLRPKFQMITQGNRQTEDVYFEEIFDINGKYEREIILSDTSPVEILITQLPTIFKIEIISKYPIGVDNLGNPLPTPLTNITIKVDKGPDPTKTIVLGMDNLFVFNVHKDWRQYLTSISLSTDATTTYPVSIKIFGK